MQNMDYGVLERARQLLDEPIETFGPESKPKYKDYLKENRNNKNLPHKSS